jgi:hypothetical protein
LERDISTLKCLKNHLEKEEEEKAPRVQRAVQMTDKAWVREQQQQQQQQWG